LLAAHSSRPHTPGFVAARGARQSSCRKVGRHSVDVRRRPSVPRRRDCSPYVMSRFQEPSRRVR
jgi:hypothetical protein